MKAQHIRRSAFMVLVTTMLAMSVTASSVSAGGDPTRPRQAGEGGALVVPEGDQVFHTSDSQITPGVDNQGWWSATSGNVNVNDNYIVGQLDGEDLRNFFTFDVSSLSGTAVSATLLVRCFRPFSRSASEVYSLSRVSTPTQRLNFNNGTSVAIWRDLGDGTYGAHEVTLATDCPTPDTLLGLPLNDAAVADINAASRWFNVGGKLASTGGAAEQYLFGFSSAKGIQALVVQTE
jgi:hypothetical protein